LKSPEAFGEKVTSMVQLAPAARVDPQVLLSAKLALAMMAETLSVAVPVFFNVIDSAVVVAPTISWPKASFVTDSETAGAPPADIAPVQPLIQQSPSRMTIAWGFISSLQQRPECR
jgi:hypothetical protein